MPRATQKKASSTNKGERLLDLPLPRGRTAPAAFVFGKSASYLRLDNLGEPLFWRLALARTAKADGDAVAAGFDPNGSRAARAFAEPNAVDAAPEEPAEELAAAINGVAEYGLQTADDHEYFLSKFGDLVGVIRVKRKGDDGWSATMAKSNVPRVLTPEAVAEGLMPPPGHSGLPKSLEAVVPESLHYWKTAGEEARAMRDALVEDGFFTDDCVKAVDGELRKVEVKYFLYEPSAKRRTAKRAVGALLADAVPANVRALKSAAPTDAADWLEALDAVDSPSTLAFLSGSADVSAREIARAVETFKGEFVAIHADTRANRAALSPVGVLFKLDGAPDQVFCSSFAPAAGVVQPEVTTKNVDFQGIAVTIDRPVGFVQTGKDATGREWTRTYSCDYGFFPRTKGGDGDELDVYVGPSATSKRVFWVAQNKFDGSFDEFKVFLGFDRPSEAMATYAAHTPRELCGGFSETRIEQVKALLGVDPVTLAKRLSASAVRKVHGVTYEEVRRAVGAAIEESNTSEAGAGAMPVGVWVIDLTDEHAIFERHGELLRVAYTYANGTASLSGAPEAVVRRYEPIGAGAGAPPAMPPAMPDGEAAKAIKGLSLHVVTKAAPAGGDEQIVFGIVLEPDVVDAQNDIYTAESIRAAAERFMEVHGNMGLMHKGIINDKVQILESYLAPVDFTVGDTAIKKGTWLMSCRVADPELWAAVKGGSFTGFSIGGSAIRTPVSAPPV